MLGTLVSSCGADNHLLCLLSPGTEGNIAPESLLTDSKVELACRGWGGVGWGWVGNWGR